MTRKATLAAAAIAVPIVATIALAQERGFTEDDGFALRGKHVTIHVSPDSLGAPTLSGGFSLNGRRLTISGTFLESDGDWIRIRRSQITPAGQPRFAEIALINTNHVIAIAASENEPWDDRPTSERTR